MMEEKNVHVHVHVHGWVWASVHICAWCVCCMCSTVCGNVSAYFTGGCFFACRRSASILAIECIKKKKNTQLEFTFQLGNLSNLGHQVN